MVFPSVGHPCQPIPNRYPQLGRMLGWLDGLRPSKLLSFFFFASYSFSIFCFVVLNSNLIPNLFCRNSRLGLHINTIHTLLLQYVLLGRSLGVLHTIAF
jgi:hypothetical protein